MIFRRQIKLSATSRAGNERRPILQQLVTYKFSHQHLPLTAATSPDFTANADTVSKATFAVMILLNLCIHAVGTGVFIKT